MDEIRAKKISQEYGMLMRQAESQLVEHKLWLQLQISELDLAKFGMSPSALMRLIDDVNSIRIEQTKIDKVDGAHRITVAYGYPDELHAFLSRSDAPPAMSLAKSGGVTVKDEPTARRVK